MCEEEQEPRDDEADALEEEDGLVAHVVCNQEDWEKECKVGVCPNWENLVGNLGKKRKFLCYSWGKEVHLVLNGFVEGRFCSEGINKIYSHIEAACDG